MEMKYVNVSVVSCTVGSSFILGFAWGADFLFIIVIQLYGSNYPHAAWEKEDAQIRIRLWNSMKSSVISSLVYLDIAKQVWDWAKEMFFGVGNLFRTYDLH